MTTKPVGENGEEGRAEAATPASRPVEPQVVLQGDATGGVIPYKNAPALVAYYLGLFSIFPVLGLLLGLAAVPLGIAGLRKKKAEPWVKGSVHAWVGIGCGGLGILVWGGLLILVLLTSR